MSGEFRKIKSDYDNTYYWKYFKDNNDKHGQYFYTTDRSYDIGENQNGDKYYIKYGDYDAKDKAFDLYPIEDDLYQVDDYTVLPVDNGKYYDPSVTWLENLNVSPKTGRLVLSTYYPLGKDYPWTGHSSLELLPDDIFDFGNLRQVSTGGSTPGYNFITNNCSDATREVLEQLFNKKMNPFLFTTPGDSRDFLLENGGKENKDGSVEFKLTEEQLLRLRDYIDSRKEWDY